MNTKYYLVSLTILTGFLEKSTNHLVCAQNTKEAELMAYEHEKHNDDAAWDEEEGCFIDDDMRYTGVAKEIPESDYNVLKKYNI